MTTYSIEETIAFLSANGLFEGLTQQELTLLASLGHYVNFEANEKIIEENEINDQIYLIKEGAVEVYKWDENVLQKYHIATLGSNQVIGESSLFENIPRTASIRALEQTTLFELSVSKIRNASLKRSMFSNMLHKFLPEKSPDATFYESLIFSKIVRNLSRNLSDRIRDTNLTVVESLRKELEHTKARIVMGNFIITIITILVLYLLLLGYVRENHKLIINTMIISAPMIGIFAAIVFFYLLKTGLPLSAFGFTLKGWAISLKECLIASVIYMILITIVKWFLVNSNEFPEFTLFDGTIFSPNLTTTMQVTSLIIYALFVPLQEFIVRGAMQSSFLEFLISPNRRFWSILLSNLLFATTHFHISVRFGLMVITAGFMWGYLFSRHRTLVGVVVSHIIIGIWAVFILGIEGNQHF